MQEEQDNSIEHDIAAQTFTWQKAATKPSKKYLWSSLFGLILLIIQVDYFLGYSMTQNPQTRPTLSIINKLLKRPLATYKNINDFTVIGSSISAIQNKQHQVQISFITHAELPQDPPLLLLTLRNLQGGILAQRIFDRATYQQASALNSLILPNELFTINIIISSPQVINGYSIELK